MSVPPNFTNFHTNLHTKWKTDGQMTLISAIGHKMCKKAMPVYIRSNGIEKMQIQFLICYTKVTQCWNSNVMTTPLGTARGRKMVTYASR